MLHKVLKASKHALLTRWMMPYSPVPGLSPVLYRTYINRTDLTVLDLGAHCGDFTKALMQAATVKRALLVEPLPAFAGRLRTDEQLRSFDIEPCAVGARDGEITLDYYPHAPFISSALALDTTISGMTEMARGRPQQIVCPLRRVDTLTARRPDFAAIDLMKIDVQGLEHEVIAGAPETLARTRAVYCEVSFRPVYSGSCTFSDVHSLLRERGFMLASLDPGHRAPDGELLQADALFVRRDGPQP